MTEAGTERQRVRALIEGAGIAVLMNVDAEGMHVGRPMLPLLGTAAIASSGLWRPPRRSSRAGLPRLR
jgi:hypothetical protein